MGHSQLEVKKKKRTIFHDYKARIPQDWGLFFFRKKGTFIFLMHLNAWELLFFSLFPPPPRITNSTRLMFLVLWTSSSLIPGLTWLHKSNCTLGLQTSGGGGIGSPFYYYFFLNCWGEHYNPASVVSAVLPLWYFLSPTLSFSSEFKSGEQLGVVLILWQWLPPLTSGLGCRYIYKKKTYKDLSSPYLTAQQKQQINSPPLRQW